MKISVSLPQADIEFLDSYAHDSGAGTRSGALHDAIQLLRSLSLRADYGAAWDEWAESADAEPWDATSADGLRR
ncbi:ribbon-helix-helix domain-containing protein [Angustibacter sp. McL0619]|uniref:ribbon-helix-helix domain-containing protein n=1 Tax=Angustibacter sp. McL0619 TaxID=3415676 RepID=UPI003CEFD5BD